MTKETCLISEIKMIELRKVQNEGLEINYALYQISSEFKRKYFAIEILLENDASFTAFGEDLDDAYSFYMEVVNGAVTPTSLCEILADRINCSEY